MLPQQYSLLYFIFWLLPLALASSTAKPGCPERCGNLWIPFPFGVGSSCSFNQFFEITCNNSADPPKAYLPYITDRYTEIIEIKEFQIRIKYPDLLARACYSSSNNYYQDYLGLSGTPYTLSGENWLTTIGCDDLMMPMYFGNATVSGGCVSYCQENSSSRKGSCPNNVNGLYVAGNGCCRTPIAKDSIRLGVNLTDLSKSLGRAKLYPCSYAFIEEKRAPEQSEFLYPLSYLEDGMFADSYTLRDPPVIRLDWRIVDENCSDAQSNSSINIYACMSPNSDCVDLVDSKIGGYNCKCQQGYEGNPYLAEGCQDIDECADNKTKPCNPNSKCINTVGSFYCLCPEGYYGDGKEKGTGCTRLPKSRLIINVVIGVGSGVGFLLLFSVCFVLHKVSQKRKKKMRKENFFKRNGGLLLQQQTNEGTLGKTKLFCAKELETATDNFNESRILGQGGQGTVYKGMLSHGKIVAIKKSKLVNEDQLEQFINEVVILSQINHRNVVKLLGCCLETEVPLLVYEFVPNGTLFDLIHDPNTEFPVSWDMRVKIMVDVAGALSHLHYTCSIPIYHRDIKSSNILLDEKYVVKVSDFGTSMSFAVDQTHLTTMVKGTIGYLDPEYFQSSQFTEKSDVYSFGVVLLELLTGQRPISLERSTKEESLVARFLAYMEANNLDTILDSRVLEQGRKEE